MSNENYSKIGMAVTKFFTKTFKLATLATSAASVSVHIKSR